MDKEKLGFYSGILTACVVINLFDQPAIIEVLVGTLGEVERKEFASFARHNREFELAGLDKVQWTTN